MADADAQAVTRALEGRWHGSYGTARCPAHDDRTPSLSLRDGHTGRLLLRCHAGCDWRSVADALRGMGLLPERGGPAGAGAPVDPTARAARERDERGEAARRARQARWCWEGTQALPGTPAERYLRGRGIMGPLPPTLRFHPACWHAPTARRLPALVALVEGAPDFAVQRIYLTPEGRKIAPAEDAKMMLGATLGGAVRLGVRRRLSRGSQRLVVAEGIETALSVALGAAGPLEPGAQVWAALTTSNLAGLRLPTRAGCLVIAADGDRAGHKAAEALAERARAAGWRVELRPAPEGQDWNDALREAARAGAGV